MNWFLFSLAALAWYAIGLAGSGFEFAYFQREYPSLAKRDYRRDRQSALWVALGGIIILLICIFDSDYQKHGWMNPLRRTPKAGA